VLHAGKCNFRQTLHHARWESELDGDPPSSPPSPPFGAALLPTCHPRPWAGPSSAHLSAVAVLSQSPHWTLDSRSGWIEFWRMKHHLERKRGLYQHAECAFLG
jgi:hypothetical protein